MDTVIDRMDDYFLNREDWDTLVELGLGDYKDDIVLKKISAATKSALTRRYRLDASQSPYVLTSSQVQRARPPHRLPQGPGFGQGTQEDRCCRTCAGLGGSV